MWPHLAGGGWQVTIVLFVGGITYTEISALRWLKQNSEEKREIIIAATSILNGNSLLDSLAEKPKNNLKKLD